MSVLVAGDHRDDGRQTEGDRPKSLPQGARAIGLGAGA
jgi:hypothetical protein